MTGKEIIILMKMLDITQQSIADKLHITQPAIRGVIIGLRRTPRIRQAIANAIGRPVEQIWPPETPVKKADLNKKHTKNKSRVQGKNRE